MRRVISGYCPQKLHFDGLAATLSRQHRYNSPLSVCHSDAYFNRSGATFPMSFLSNLFKPKWQHSDPAVRKQALLALTPESGSDNLRQMASADSSPEIRQLALKRLNDLDLFETAANADTDPDVRELAKKMVLQFLSGQHPSAPPLAARLAKIRSTQDAQLKEYVAKNADEAELRLAALIGISKESVAADLAINDTDLEVRRAALERVRSKATLERIARATKNKDKVISRNARERYEQIVADEEKPRRISEQRRNICVGIEGLGRTGDWIREKNQFDALCAQWAALEPIALEDFTARFTNASDEFNSRYAAYVARNAERIAAENAWVPIRAEKETLLHAFDALAVAANAEDIADETINEKKLELESLQNRWNATAALPQSEQTSFDTRLRQSSSAIRATLEKATRKLGQAQNLLALCVQAETELAKPAAPNEKTLENLERRWREANRDIAASKELAARFTQALTQARDKRKEELALEDKARVALSELQTALQLALDEGRLSEALALHKQANESLKSLEKLTAPDVNKLKAKLAEQYAQIQKLNNWRTWANTPQKELLCVQVEALIGSQDHPREIAGAISAAREAWQKLGPAEKGSSAELWARFQTACDNAYAPCKTFFAAESEQRASHLAARTEFLDKLDTFLAQIDWATADWKKIEPLPQQLLSEWQQMGPTDRAHSAALSKRFHTSLQRVRDAIGEEWNRNLPRKQSVVARAVALVETTDFHTAAEQIKKLQAEWKTLGRVGQKQERELWAQFRSACDQVFAKRDQARIERDGQVEQGLVDKKNLVQEAESIAALTGIALLKAQDTFREIQEKFAASAPTRRDEDQKLERNLSQAAKKLEQAVYIATRHSALERVMSVRPRADVCAAAERALAAGSAISLLTADEWNAVAAPADAQHTALLNQRWKKIGDIAAAVSTGSSTALLAFLGENLAAKSILALQFEILTGIESPADAVKARLEYQVSQLAQHMGKPKEQDKWTAFLVLEAQWLASGVCAEAEELKLEARHVAALTTLKQEFSAELHNYC